MSKRDRGSIRQLTPRSGRKHSIRRTTPSKRAAFLLILFLSVVFAIALALSNSGNRNDIGFSQQFAELRCNYLVDGWNCPDQEVVLGELGFDPSCSTVLAVRDQKIYLQVVCNGELVTEEQIELEDLGLVDDSGPDV